MARALEGWLAPSSARPDGALGWKKKVDVKVTGLYIPFRHCRRRSGLAMPIGRPAGGR